MGNILIINSGDFDLSFYNSGKNCMLVHKKCGFSWTEKYKYGELLMSCNCMFPFEIPENIEVIYRMLKDGE